jgi:hypothetical protein
MSDARKFEFVKIVEVSGNSFRREPKKIFLVPRPLFST